MFEDNNSPKDWSADCPNIRTDTALVNIDLHKRILLAVWWPNIPKEKEERVKKEEEEEKEEE